MAKEVNFPATLTKGGTTVGSCKIINKPELSTESVRIDGLDTDVELRIPSKKRKWGDIAITIIPATFSELTDIYTDVVNESMEVCILVDPQNTFTFSGWYKSAVSNPANVESIGAVEIDAVLAVYGDVIITDTP
jgi:hypothetical protein